MQFNTSYELLLGEHEGFVKIKNVVEGEERKSLSTAGLRKEANALYYVQVLGIYHSDWKGNRLKPLSVAE